MAPAPRVTLGIATYERDTYLAEAVASCLRQDAPGGLEVLVVLDGGRNPRIDEILAGFDDPRLRIVRHEANRGIAEAYNTIIREGRGELVAMLGDDDVCEPDRIARQVAVFDAHPDTGAVVGDALVIDAQGRTTGRWTGADLPPARLLEALVRRHNHLCDPTRMVARRLYDEVGGYDARFGIAQDFHFWMRAAAVARIRHTPGGPVARFRRHGENTSDESQRDREVADVELVLEEAIEALGLPRLVPELDWAVLAPETARRRALERLAAILDARALPLPGLAARLRRRAAEVAPAAPPVRHGRRIVMTAYGWEDSGGGTLVPRLVARELVRRGWDVTVFHAATGPGPAGVPYEITERDDAGVRLVGVHGREHGMLDLGNPLREIDDPPITAAFADLLARVRPDVVHVHNLHNLGGRLLDVAGAHGVPVVFTPHNHWLLCPRAYLVDGDGAICAGPGDGRRCASCVGSPDVDGHARRRAALREAVERNVGALLAVSGPVGQALVAGGVPSDLVRVVPQALPAVDEIWSAVGRDRRPGRPDGPLRVGFFGSVLPHKGVQVLVEAASRCSAPLSVVLHGEVPARMRETLERRDRRGIVEIAGHYSPSELPARLAEVDVAVVPSLVWETQGLVAAECLAARVPVVVAAMGGLTEQVRDGIDGLVVPGADADALAAALQRLATEPGLVERLQAGIRAPRTFAQYVDDLEVTYAGTPAAPLAPDAEPVVDWLGEAGTPTSLATINDAVTGRLPAHGVRVVRRSWDGTALGGPGPRVADVEVRHRWPPSFRPPASGRLALIQPWEFGAIPADWVAPLQRDVDEVWVPSEYTRRMYLDSGVDADRVHVVPNGVDLDVFRPDGPPTPLALPAARRFLYVGPPMGRKGTDLLLDAWHVAFPGRDDVSLVWKDVAVTTTYRNADRAALQAAASGDPRIVHLTDDLDRAGLAALIRAADVLVLPYRGEGFGMPVLEAMACGTPVICTGGGPTDEFCPPEAGWRIPSRRAGVPDGLIDGKPCAGAPWLLEPDLDGFVRLLREAADASADELRARGAAGRAAAERLGWDAVAAAYAERVRALAARPARTPEVPPADLDVESARKVLATPAWCAEDDLPALLEAWAEHTRPADDVALVLVADPAVDGDPDELAARVLGCGVDLEACAAVTIHLAPADVPQRDAALHAAAEAYVPLHAGSAGQERRARAAGSDVVLPGGLGAWLARAPAASL